MMKAMLARTTRFNTVLFSVTVIVIAVLTVWSPAAAQLTLSRSPSTDQSYATTTHGAGYWTPERAAAARALPWPAAPAHGSADGFAETSSRTPGWTDGGLGTGKVSVPDGKPASGVSGAAADAEFGSSVDEDEDFGSADVYDFDLVNKNTVLQLEYPWRTVGKMFFDTGGGSGYCSASVIGPNNAIVTAAHCCYNRLAGDFYDNFAFVPAMRKAGRPYGTFPYSTVTVLTAYALGGARQDDVCVLNLSPNEVGQSVSNVTGWLGRSWDGPTVQHRFAFGYPSNIKNGKFAAECTAEGYASCGSNLVNGMGCRMTYGSSGGPWLHTHKKFVAGANNFVDSVVSGWDSCTGTFGQSFNGPRFTSQNIKILCDAAGC